MTMVERKKQSMDRRWHYMSEPDGLSGSLFLIEPGWGERAIVRIQTAGPGHCLDTGRLIAALLTKHEQALSEK